MNKVLAIGIVMLTVPLASGQLNQSYHLGENSLEVEQSIGLECSGTNCPVNYWSFEWPKLAEPEDVKIEDTRGKIEDWETDNQSFHIETNTGALRSEEKVNITYETSEPVESEGNLTFARFTPPNLQDHTSEFRISSKNLTSVAYGNNLAYPDSSEYKFESDIRPEVVLSRAEGERNQAFNFVNSEPVEIEAGLDLIDNKTGVNTRNYEIPVVVYGSNRYTEEYDDWSVGKLDGGIIYLKNGDADLRSTLVHETVHAINKDQLDWKRFESHIIDEGLATYIEGVYRDERAESGDNIQISSGLFGDNRKFYGSNETYEVGSRGEIEQLVEVVESKDDFYKDWKTSQRENREFGYAYSELIIKNHQETPSKDIKDFYNVKENKTLSQDEKWQKVNNITELHPCSRKDDVHSCLEDTVQKSDVVEEGYDKGTSSSRFLSFIENMIEFLLRYDE